MKRRRKTTRKNSSYHPLHLNLVPQLSSILTHFSPKLMQIKRKNRRKKLIFLEHHLFSLKMNPYNEKVERKNLHPMIFKKMIPRHHFKPKEKKSYPMISSPLVLQRIVITKVINHQWRVSNPTNIRRREKRRRRRIS